MPSELDLEGSIIATRSRRKNAGSRLKMLIDMQEPLDDEDQIFKETADDEEFDVTKLEEQETEDKSDGEEGDETSGDEDQRAFANSDDENFSDSSDSSIENDQEPVDAGEAALIQEQRINRKAQRTRERKKMFNIRVKADGEKKSKRNYAPRVQTLLATDRRSSQRTSALRNKKEVIERLLEAERRRAEYVAPVVKQAPKMTQEQRLEQAKITERKNTASLHYLVELEEYRKHQQRLALLGRRAKLVRFIRYTSKMVLDYPVVEVVKEEPVRSERKADAVDAVDRSNDNDISVEHTQPDGDLPEKDAGESDMEPSEAADAVPVQAVEGQDEDDHSSKEAEEPGSDEPKNEAMEEPEHPYDVELEAAKAKNSETAAENDAPKENQEACASETDAASLVPVHPLDQMSEDVELQKPEPEIERSCAGPPNLVHKSFLTLHEFPDSAYNRFAVKSIILGSQAFRPEPPPAKRICPFSGKEARYLSPSTGIAYFSSAENNIIKMLQQDKLVWSSALGGVYLGPRDGQRHAKGVPEGFN